MNYCNLSQNIKEMLRRLPTPFFLFDLDHVAAKLTMLREALFPDQVYYAVKCNSLSPILSTLEAAGCGPEKLAKIMAMNPRRFIDIATMIISKDERDANASKALITRIMTHGWEMPPLRYAPAFPMA